MKDFEEVISNSGNRKVILSNTLSDPSMWIINVYKKILFFNRKIKSFWFNSKEDAEQFALEHSKTLF